jgi:hypothetical protein
MHPSEAVRVTSLVQGQLIEDSPFNYALRYVISQYGHTCETDIRQSSQYVTSKSSHAFAAETGTAILKLGEWTTQSECSCATGHT